MDYQVEYDRLLRKIITSRSIGGSKLTGGPIVRAPRLKKTPTVGSYKKEFVKTKQYNEKTKRYELWDDRTENFYKKAEAEKYLASEENKRVKKYYLDNFGTETPEEDLKYLQQGAQLQKYKGRKNLSIDNVASWIHGARYLGSKKITDTDQKVFDAQHDKNIAKREEKLDKLRINTSYGKKDKEEERTEYTPEKHNERVDRLKNLFINEKINQNEANLDLTLTNGTR